MLKVEALEGHRLLSRVLQTLELQRTSMQRVCAEEESGTWRIEAIFTSETASAHRIEALLYKLADVRVVTITAS